MDDSTFDRLARVVAAPQSRRGVIAAAAAALGGIVTGADAKRGKGRNDSGRRPGAEGPCKSTKRPDNVCSKASDCCTGICNTGAGKKNKDGKGRCRCVRQGGKCSEDRNCCSRRNKKLSCIDGVCGGGSTPPPPPPPAIPTSEACTQSDVCFDGRATCTAYTNGGPDGTYCLFANTTECTLYDECESSICGVAGNGKTCCETGSLRHVLNIDRDYGSADDQIKNPYGTAFLSDGRLLFTDELNRRIQEWKNINGAWTWQRNFGYPNQSGEPNPYDILVKNDLVYMSIDPPFAIAVWKEENGAWSEIGRYGTVGSGDGQLLSSKGMAFDSQGRLLVADKDNDRITVWAENDGVLTWVGSFGASGSGDGQLGRPLGVTAGPDGTIYVADTNNHRITLWREENGAWSQVDAFGAQGTGDGQMKYPYDAIWAQHRVFVADNDNGRTLVWKKTASGWVQESSAGSNGSNDDQLSYQGNMTIGPDERLYIADVGNTRISVWEMSCAI